MKIVVRTSDGQDWHTVDSVGYGAENELQDLLAKSPSLVPVGDIREGASPLVAAAREVMTPSGGAIDVLACSSNGELTIVECKLAANSDRRQVLAQVLDYASDLWHMPYDELNERVKKVAGVDFARLAEAGTSGTGWDEEAFRQGVTDALTTGMFTLVIAVDEIDEHLRRMVRYLNLTGKPEFRLAALEMERFQSEGTEMLVPTVYSPHLDAPGDSSRWDDARFYRVCEASLSAEVTAVIRDLHQWGKENIDSVEYGLGRTTGSLNFYSKLRDEQYAYAFRVTSAGLLDLNYGYLTSTFGTEFTNRHHRAITAIPSFSQVSDDPLKYPSIRIATKLVAHPEDIQSFKEAITGLRDLLDE
ncbi:MAG: hypothetical protein IIC94_02810 [Chloroflexi bacterium]|nr:hypothetical protein [Chloroflexota bacterium]